MYMNGLRRMSGASIDPDMSSPPLDASLIAQAESGATIPAYAQANYGSSQMPTAASFSNATAPVLQLLSRPVIFGLTVRDVLLIAAIIYFATRKKRS